MPHFMESDEVASCLIVITVHDVEVEPAKWRDVVTIGYNEDVFPVFILSPSEIMRHS